MIKPYIIGIAGGTSSGKTTVAKEIIKKIGNNNVTYINHDNYYKDLSHLSSEDRAKINFDHPNSLDTKTLFNDIQKIINKQEVNIPIYDFITHTRKKNTNFIIPKNIIILEGILIFNELNIRNFIDIKIFVDTPSDERLIRRIQRDIDERGRTLKNVIFQYKETVKPMHQQFIEPTKNYADFIIPNGYNSAVVDLVVDSLVNKLNI